MATLRFVEDFTVLRRAGLMAPSRPDRLVRAAIAVRRYGMGIAAGVAATAARYPERVCVIDERGQTTWGELDTRTNAIARGLAASGARAGGKVALCCRNHRGFVEALAAASKLGADVLLLNTGFAAPQLAEVLERERPDVVVVDDEFLDLLDEGARARAVVAWADGPTDTPTLDALAESGESSALKPDAKHGHVIVLTSGTTGTPKGAARRQDASITSGVAMLERIPYRSADVMAIPAPLFHSWGLGNLSLGLATGATYVLRRRFEPAQLLADIERHRVNVLAAVPVMIGRVLELSEQELTAYDTSSLRIVALSGSEIPAGIAERFMDRFGDIVYNLYGSTEVGWGAIAGPEDLRRAPGTAGRPPRGTEVRILDGDGNELPAGRTGAIYVGSDLVFDGYTGGGSRPEVGGLMDTGDTGHLDTEGRLFVAGRADDMIVSGGENVYPREVEDLLVSHPAVRDAAVVGVVDDEFGSRLEAHVVLESGADVGPEDLRNHVRDHLARFKVPRAVHVVDALPRNPTGKVQRKVLRGETAG